jgi:uncharacterized protein
MLIKRYIETAVINDLEKKMVFIGGPRQAGKTTCAKMMCDTIEQTARTCYLNWDIPEDRETIMREQFPTHIGFLILDEIHKYNRWRQVVKGLYDKYNKKIKIVVTGSARLDYYRRGGDSLQGRYHYYRLLPFTLPELSEAPVTSLQKLFTYGGFPEPFLQASEKDLRRWSREYRTRIVREDLRDLENVRDIDTIEHLVLRLPDLVGSPLSLNALSGDLQVSHQSVSRWISILENLYMIFRIYPFGAPAIRAVKKEAKHYHFDWTVIHEDGPRFENLIACHLYKWCMFIEDSEGYDMELRYFRDVDKREVDFVIIKQGIPIYFVECKAKFKTVSSSLVYLKNKFPDVPAIQVSLEGEKDFITKQGIRVCPAHIFLLSFV